MAGGTVSLRRVKENETEFEPAGISSCWVLRAR
jgi:hypothetical protein